MVRRQAQLAGADFIDMPSLVQSGLDDVVLDLVQGQPLGGLRDARGKLIASTARELEGPEVSISHSGGWAAAAVSTLGPVGIDVECSHFGRDISGIAEASFGEAECQEVARGGAGVFYRIWTLREAMAKADGCGLALVIDRLERVSAMTAVGAWQTVMDGQCWLLMYAQPDDGVHLALAVARVACPNGWSKGLPVVFG